VLLAGDAAGLINPLNGEGIQYALLSGRWAAETVIACAASHDFSGRALGAYAARVDDELRYDLSLSRTIVQLIRNRVLDPLWLEALRIIAAQARVDAEHARIKSEVNGSPSGA
jgi:flavin-dependent dehydrogenase